jgi:hypothetical protein
MFDGSRENVQKGGRAAVRNYQRTGMHHRQWTGYF